MRLKDISDDEYDRHLSGECDYNCKVCAAEEQEVFKKQKQKKKKDEGKGIER